jgi:protein-L-isoaspartate(D-aspartate) O-methyltransferase
MNELIAELEQNGVLRSPSIKKVLEAIDRADFIPEQLYSNAYENTALPIGFGQTISQPYTVIFMLEKLRVRRGDRVLEVGYGSGWVTALLANLVGSSGRVYAFEIVPELCAFGKQNIKKYSAFMHRTQLICVSAEHGYGAEAPFNCIIAAAAVKNVPNVWREQLVVHGRMIYPRDNSLFLEIKKADGTFKVQEFPGFVFVPFRNKQKN